MKGRKWSLNFMDTHRLARTSATLSSLPPIPALRTSLAKFRHASPRGALNDTQMTNSIHATFCMSPRTVLQTYFPLALKLSARVEIRTPSELSKELRTPSAVG